MTARNIFAMLDETAGRYGKAPALYQPYTHGILRKHRIYSWNEVKQAAMEIAAGLRHSGIQKGDVAALATETRAEFYLADLGIMAGGSIAAALYITYPAHELVQTLRACGAKAVFVEDPETLARLKGGADSPLPVLWVLLTGEAEGAITLQELRDRGRSAISEAPDFFTRIRDAAAPSDHAILYLTSGATGVPKMVLVSHSALLANAEMGPLILNAGPEDRAIAFLPSAHIAQRVVMELIPVRCGIQVWFVENLNKLPQELKSVRPTLLLAPPRVWERIFHSISTEIQKRSPAAKKLFYAALGLGLQAAELRHRGKPVPRWLRTSLKIADRIVFRKVRARLGGRLRLGLSGAAPLGKKLAQFYEAIGLTLIEGYGLTEGGVVSVNRPEKTKAGTIGKPLPGVEVRLAEDGELLVRSAALFSGYFNDPQATAEVMRDGWLATGDIAEIDNEGYISITGRKKELIISSNGKKIYPARVEGLFKLEPIVSQILLVGDRLPYLTALFTINAAIAEGLKEGEVFAEVQKAVRRVNQQLAPFEQIRKFRVLDREFSLENGEMTPTMKVRRAKVLENFREVVSGLYAGKEDSL
jgi:long-chain acyl-CoA synthetase